MVASTARELANDCFPFVLIYHHRSFLDSRTLWTIGDCLVLTARSNRRGGGFVIMLWEDYMLHLLIISNIPVDTYYTYDIKCSLIWNLECPYFWQFLHWIIHYFLHGSPREFLCLVDLQGFQFCLSACLVLSLGWYLYHVLHTFHNNVRYIVYGHFGCFYHAFTFRAKRPFSANFIYLVVLVIVLMTLIMVFVNS